MGAAIAFPGRLQVKIRPVSLFGKLPSSLKKLYQIAYKYWILVPVLRQYSTEYLWYVGLRINIGPLVALGTFGIDSTAVKIILS